MLCESEGAGQVSTVAREAPKLERGVPTPTAQIEQIQQLLGYPLPDAFVEFTKQYGNAFVGGYVEAYDKVAQACERFSILGFFGGEGDGSLSNKLRSHDDLQREGILPFGDCVLGNLWVIDCKIDQSIHYIDYYSTTTNTHRIDDCFECFLARIQIWEED